MFISQPTNAPCWCLLLRVTFPLPAVRRPLDFLQQHAMVSTHTSRLSRNDDVIARPKRVARDPLFGKLSRRSAFDYPQLRLALFVGRLHFHERVRIAPNELLQRSFDFYSFAVHVGRRSGVMREALSAAQEKKYHRGK